MTPKLVPTSPPTPPDREANPFRYGWRDVPHMGPDGNVTWERRALTLEDVLHPQEGDVIPENSRHNDERDYLKRVFRKRLAGRRGVCVLSDCLIDWGREDMRDHSPDVTLIFDVTDPSRPRGKFYVAQERTRPSLIVEIVSPDTRVNDVERKFAEYYQVGVLLYVIVDQEREGGPRRIRAYRYTAQGYEAIPLDERGRVLLEELGIRLGLRENGVVCYDAVTDEEVGDYDQVCQAWEEAEQRARGEAEARAAAERQTQAAEQRQREAAEARAAAEKRLQELEAELRRLRGEDPT
jgi:colicin import membrane protein